MAFARAEAARHTLCLRLIESLDGLEEAAFMEKGKLALDAFDQNGVSYLVQRFEDFKQFDFYTLITSSNPAEYAEGLRYHFSRSRRMLAQLIELLARQEERLQDAARTA